MRAPYALAACICISLDVAQAGACVRRRRLIVLGCGTRGLAGSHATPARTSRGYCEGELEEHLAGMADTDVPESPGPVDLGCAATWRMMASSSSNSSGPRFHQFHALPAVDD